jgi:hypothetical protein
MEPFIYVPWYSPQFGKGVWYNHYIPVPILLPTPSSPDKPVTDIARTKTPLQALDTRNMPPITEAEVKQLNTERFLEKNKGKFFVVLAHCEDDIHKSLKYGIWTSSVKGNQILNQVFQTCKGIEPVYLFFSVIGSQMFVGFAEMISAVNFSISFNGWYPDFSNLGIFGVRWIFVKDLPFQNVFHVKVARGLSVTQAGDCQEVPKYAAFKLFRLFADMKNFRSVLEDFKYYDSKEEVVRSSLSN